MIIFEVQHNRRGGEPSSKLMPKLKTTECTYQIRAKMFQIKR